MGLARPLRGRTSGRVSSLLYNALGVCSVQCAMPVCKSVGQKGRAGRTWKAEGSLLGSSDKTHGDLYGVTWSRLATPLYGFSGTHPSHPSFSRVFDRGTQTGAPVSCAAYGQRVGQKPQIPDWMDGRPGLWMRGAWLLLGWEL